MRIAQITSSLHEPLGGAEQYCIELSRWLVANGHDVTVLGSGASPHLVKALGDEGISVYELTRTRPYTPGTKGRRLQKVVFHALDVLDTVRTPLALRRSIAGEFDVVHVHRWQGLGAAVLALGTTPTVHTVHDFALVDTAATSIRRGEAPVRLRLPQRIRAGLMNRATRHLDIAVFPTQRTAERHRALGYSGAKHDTVIPHGWKLPAPSRTQTRERGSTPLQVTFMGKLIEDKGVDTLLDAWQEGIPGARLVFAGAGRLEEAVCTRVAPDSLEFRGWLGKADQAELLAGTDLLALPSKWPENFPLVVAEALLAGVPVLATRVSAPEFLEHGRNALIVEPTAAAIRAEIIRIRDLPAELTSLRAGAAASGSDLDMDTHGSAIVETYRLARSRWTLSGDPTGGSRRTRGTRRRESNRKARS